MSSLWIVSVLLFQICLGSKEKRLLLNDPDVINARFESMERQLQQLVQQNQQLTGDVKVLQQQNHQLTQATQNLTQRNQQLVGDVTRIQMDYYHLTQTTQTLTRNVNLLEQENQQLTGDLRLLQQSESRVSHGSTYTRWGRTTCPTNVSDLVYTGFTAGQNYHRSSDYYGGPANILCLPRDPDLSNKSLTAEWSTLYGSEYESNNYFAHDSQNNDVPCSVCRNAKASSSIMIPGRRSCYPGWTKEYQGILGSGNIAYKASSYICVDSSPEYLQHGDKNEEGFLLYPVTAKCGTLPCPPYHDHIMVECVVCSK